MNSPSFLANSLFEFHIECDKSPAAAKILRCYITTCLIELICGGEKLDITEDECSNSRMEREHLTICFLFHIFRSSFFIDMKKTLVYFNVNKGNF